MKTQTTTTTDDTTTTSKTAFFTYRGVAYKATGYVGDCFVSRRDGRKIRGEKMHPGMIQTGISRTLENAAKCAIEAESE